MSKHFASASVEACHHASLANCAGTLAQLPYASGCDIAVNHSPGKRCHAVAVTLENGLIPRLSQQLLIQMQFMHPSAQQLYIIAGLSEAFT